MLIKHILPTGAEVTFTVVPDRDTRSARVTYPANSGLGWVEGTSTFRQAYPVDAIEDSVSAAFGALVVVGHHDASKAPDERWYFTGAPR